MAMASRLGTNGVCEFEKKKKKVLRTPLRTSIHSPNAALAYGNDVRGGDALISQDHESDLQGTLSNVLVITFIVSPK